ncbi:alpha/beta fold hydrolase [Spirosoma sp. HMF4905]|uniref:Alpha/beta fold hydrolase n=1 Tax=Spirosoma arboris TaxID=2682092 RepID=A0A7K1SE57_9BACT|nr:alpha/beta hydrolase [Spirosoma arboris]MVM32083.1 alpha/beta fold hydrolase [Spirosoma arboris]
MKSLLLILALTGSIVHSGRAQLIDTLLNVGTYRLYFTISKGKGVPILFEAGGGDDASVWKNILKPIAAITGTTLIAYDRAGFGKSSLDTNRHGIVNGIIGLETGLQKLGYTGNIILVAHSQGGLYASLYAFRHPKQVKAAVLIDATTPCFYEENRLRATQHIIDKDLAKVKKTNPGSYYQGLDFSSNINYVRKTPFPQQIPVTDFVAENPPFSDEKERDDWKQCHQMFVSESPNRKGIMAYGCGHFIFGDNPPMVINAIVEAYAKTVDQAKSNEILKRGIAYAIDASNTRNKTEAAYRHSEDNLNSWGYQLLQQGDLPKALKIFKLNVDLFPASWNVYDSYGETLLKSNQKEEAIRMYKKSIELNPDNKNGKKVLEEISKP